MINRISPNENFPFHKSQTVDLLTNTEKQPLELTALGQFRWSLLPKTFSIEFSVSSRLLSASERV